MGTIVPKTETAALGSSRLNSLRILVIGLTMLTLGCAAKHRQGIDVIVPVAAITKPVILKDCDLSFEPPKCKRASITYKKDQAIVSAK